MIPNYKYWNKKQLKNIISLHTSKEIIYFDTTIKNNQQDFAFAKVELNTNRTKGGKRHTR